MSDDATTAQPDPASNAIATARLGDVFVTHTLIRAEGWATGKGLGEDRLGRSGFVRALDVALERADVGSVVSVEGSWGAGKTHVLATLAHRLLTPQGEPAKVRRRPGAHSGIYWLNPWLLGEPDLMMRLTALMVEDLHAICAAAGEDKQAWYRAEVPKLVKAMMPGLLELAMGGVGIAMLATGAGPGAELLKWSSGVVRGIFARAVDAKDPEPDRTDGGGKRLTLDDAQFDQMLREAAADVSEDRVERLHKHMRHLSMLVQQAALDVGEKNTASKLYVFVDDLDRCLPEVQVRVLENLHFLTKSEGRFVFVVAMDPRLLESSLKVHYDSKEIDAEGYINKLFHLRAPLPPVDDKGVGRLLRQIVGKYERIEEDDTFNDILHETGALVQKARPEMTARALERVCARAYLAACASKSPNTAMREELRPRRFFAHLLWCEHRLVASALADDRNGDLINRVLKHGNQATHAWGDSDTPWKRAMFDAQESGWLKNLLQLAVSPSGGAIAPNEAAAWRTTLVACRAPGV